VFVTGQSAGRKTGPDYATVAYDAATGRQLWVRRHNGFGSNPDIAYSVAVSPAGTSVFVTGQSWSGRTTGAYATIAYSATTGRQLWIRRYSTPGDTYGGSTPRALTVGRDIVYVTGGNGQGPGDSYTTVAYSAATGRQLWAKIGPVGEAAANAVVVNHAGTRVYVTGTTDILQISSKFATIAYDAATGKQLWIRFY
jgi:hypothetical protein